MILHLCPSLAVDTEKCHVSILEERYAHVVMTVAYCCDSPKPND